MAALKDSHAISYSIDEPIELQRKKTLNDWKKAIMMVKHPHHPDFGPLAELYSNLMLDNHLSSVLQNINTFSLAYPSKAKNIVNT